jgi:hypothetical protein
MALPGRRLQHFYFNTTSQTDLISRDDNHGDYFRFLKGPFGYLLHLVTVFNLIAEGSCISVRLCPTSNRLTTGFLRVL